MTSEERELAGGRARRIWSAIYPVLLRTVPATMLAFIFGRGELALGVRALAPALCAAAEGADVLPITLAAVLGASVFGDGELAILDALTCAAILIIRPLVGALLSPHPPRKARGSLGALFSEDVYLRVISSAISAFLSGAVRIILGGFRFYDLFALIFSLALSPTLTALFVPCVREGIVRGVRTALGRASESPRLSLSALSILAALIRSLASLKPLGVSLSLFSALVFVLFSLESGLLASLICALVLGLAISPSHVPLLILCVLAHAAAEKISPIFASLAALSVGVAWVLALGGGLSDSGEIPALLCAIAVFFTARRLKISGEIGAMRASSGKSNAKSAELHERAEGIAAERGAIMQGERIRAISDGFSALSDVFYRLSSGIRRPSTLDLRAICERGMGEVCDGCESREICYGAEYAKTLDFCSRLSSGLCTHGILEEKNLPQSVRQRCGRIGEMTERINRECRAETGKMLRDGRLASLAPDCEAISEILNDAIEENAAEQRLDSAGTRRVSEIVRGEYGSLGGAAVIGRRRRRVILRGLGRSECAPGADRLSERIGEALGCTLGEPSFELSGESVNVFLEEKRKFSAAAAYHTEAGEGDRCGDSVTTLENFDGYFYALVSDGMGRGESAAQASGICVAFLSNMLRAGNRMESSLRLLNSVLRARGSESESECSATVDLLCLDMHTGRVRIVKSGAAPTLVLRRGSVFKLGAPCFPIGILRSVDAKETEMDAEDGDIIIMMSDGATADGESCEYLAEVLCGEGLADESVEKIRDRIVRAVRAEACERGERDDFSVIALRIKRERCEWD